MDRKGQTHTETNRQKQKWTETDRYAEKRK